MRKSVMYWVGNENTGAVAVFRKYQAALAIWECNLHLDSLVKVTDHLDIWGNISYSDKEVMNRRD